MNKYIYLAVITSLIGASVLSIEIAGFMLSPFRALTLLLVLFVIRDILKEKELRVGNIHSYRSIVFHILWLAYAVFSGLWAKDLSGWLRGVYFLGIGLSYAIIMTHYLRDKYAVLEVMKLIPLMVVPHSIIGWSEVITGYYLFISDAEKLTVYRRYRHPVSTFGNTNDFALYLLFSVIIIFVGILYFKESRRTRRFYLTLLGSSLILLYLTSSRASILGLIFGVIVFIYYALRSKSHRRKVLIFFSALIAMFFILPANVIEIVTGIDKSGLFSSQGREDIRITLIRNSLIFLKDTFGFGVGAGNIEHWLMTYAPYDTRGKFTMHNWWFEILVNYGIILFVLYLLYYIQLFKTMAYKAIYSSHHIDRGLSLQFIVIMSSFIFASVSSSSNMHTEWFWVLWGVAIAYQGLPITSINKSTANREGSTMEERLNLFALGNLYSLIPKKR